MYNEIKTFQVTATLAAWAVATIMGTTTTVAATETTSVIIIEVAALVIMSATETME